MLLLNPEDSNNIYGVNLNDNFTPEMVRDAIIKCFYEAEKDILNSLFAPSDFDSSNDAEQSKYRHIKIFIKKMFSDVQGDFDNPTKESLINVIDRCAKYASSIRDKEIIEQNYNKIMYLIENL